MFIPSTGEPVLAQVIGYSEHGDAYRCISYEREGKTVLPLYSCIPVFFSFCSAISVPENVCVVPQGVVGDRHLANGPQGVAGERLPSGGAGQGRGGGVASNRTPG